MVTCCSLIEAALVRLFGISFVSLLIGTHVDDETGQLTALPLSMLRDVESAWIGYSLFGLLTAMGTGIVWTAFRVKSYGDTFVYSVFTCLLGVVAVTPSFGGWHLIASFGLMYTLFFYHAFRLYWGGEFLWFLLHISVPCLLMGATGLSSYGIWQKSLIAYFAISLGIHDALLSKYLPRKRRRSRGRRRTHVVNPQCHQIAVDSTFMQRVAANIR